MKKLPKYINETKVCFSPKIVCCNRYSLTLPFNNKEVGDHKTAIVILKNPSTALWGFEQGKLDTKIPMLDRTVFNVVDFIYNNKNNYKQVIILNIYPHMSPYSRKINLEYGLSPRVKLSGNPVKNHCKEYSHNLREIAKILNNYNNQNADVICAWGLNSKIYKNSYSTHVTNIINEIINAKYTPHYVNTKNSKKLRFKKGTAVYPLHGSKWKNKYIII